MSDNVQHPITGAGTADVVQKTDDLSGAHVPYVKLLDGSNGGTEPITGDTANGLDVDVTRLPALAAGDNAVGRVKLTDGTDVADVLDLANSNPLTVAIVDATGDQITSFGGGTQYTEGDTDASITGTALMMEGAANALVAATGDATNGLDVDVTRITHNSGSPVTENWTSAGGTGIEIDITGYRGAVCIIQRNSGSASAGQIRFEGSIDAGTTWVLCSAVDMGASNVDYGSPRPTVVSDLTLDSTGYVTGGWPGAVFAIPGNGCNRVKVSLFEAITGDLDLDVTVMATNALTETLASASVDLAKCVFRDNRTILYSDFVAIGGVDGSTARMLTLNSGGHARVETGGPTLHDVALGAADAPNIMGGVASAAAPTSVSSDGDAVRSWHLRNGAQATVLTAAGALIGGTAAGLNVQGPDSNGGAITGRPLLQGVSDGSNVNAQRGDAAGRTIVVGGVADGAAPTGINPVLIAGQDGTNTQSIKTDSTGRPEVVVITAPSTAVTNAGTFVTQIDGAALTALQLIDDPVIQDDSGVTAGTTKVMMTGGMVVAHGSNPDAADASDGGMFLMNRHRVQFVIGGHPNVVSREYMTTASQTNDPIISVSTGSKIVVTQIQVISSNATTVNAQCRIGFGTSTVPTEPTSGADGGVDGVVFSHPGIAPGSGAIRGDGSGILGIGTDDQDLRITCDAPTSGKLTVLVSYYTIES